MTRYPVRPGVPTENGWPMVNRGSCVPIRAGRGGPLNVPVLGGDVAIVLEAFLADYAAQVEPIRTQVWGWSPDNDVADSNHMSGTAIDVNAPQYPWGLRVMPADRVARVRGVLARYRGVVYWGRDWNRPDEMHFQIGVRPGNATLRVLAAELRGGAPGPDPLPPVGQRTLQRGDQGQDVTDLQAHLNRWFPAYSRLPVTGFYGDMTAGVIREAQRRGGIAIDGITGPATRRVIHWRD